MRLFAETLLTDLSAEEIVTQLAEPELPLNPENVESRCRKLVKWGDLVRSIRETRGQRLPLPSARSRYQVSKLGGQFIEKPRSSSGGGQRTCGGAELLAPIVHSLDQIVVQVGQKVVNGPRSRSCRGYHRGRWLPHRGIPARWQRCRPVDWRYKGVVTSRPANGRRHRQQNAHFGDLESTTSPWRRAPKGSDVSRASRTTVSTAHQPAGIPRAEPRSVSPQGCTPGAEPSMTAAMPHQARKTTP